MSVESQGPAKRYHVQIAGDEIEVGVREKDGALLVSLGGVTHQADLIEVVPGRYMLVLDGRSHDLTVLGDTFGGPALRRYSLTVDGEAHQAEVGRHGPHVGRAATTSALHPGEVRSPMPGLLVAVQVAAGAEVALGQPLIIMEAMKMQMEIRAPRAGRVRQVHVTAGEEITGGRLLVTLE